MISFRLPAEIKFYTTPHQDTATTPRPDAMSGVRRGDVLAFPGQQVLVSALTDKVISFVRPQEYKVRLLGGRAYLRWANSWDDTPPPRRAKPLRRSKPIWRNIVIPAESVGVVIYQAFAEGS